MNRTALITGITGQDGSYLAAMSFVPTSWTQPMLTSEFTAVGVVRVLEAMRRVCPQARF